MVQFVYDNQLLFQVINAYTIPVVLASNLVIAAAGIKYLFSK